MHLKPVLKMHFFKKRCNHVSVVYVQVFLVLCSSQLGCLPAVGIFTMCSLQSECLRSKSLCSVSTQQVQEVGLRQTVIITNGCRWILGTGSRSVLLRLKADIAVLTGSLSIGCSIAIQGGTGNHTTRMEMSG